jgi:hypothetical protein
MTRFDNDSHAYVILPVSRTEMINSHGSRSHAHGFTCNDCGIR